MKTRYSLILSLVLTLASVVVILLKIFHPYHRVAAVSLYAVGWLPFLYELTLESKYKRKSVKVKAFKKMSRNLTLTFTLVALIVVGYSLWVLFPIKDVSFLKADPADLEEIIDSDIFLVKIYVKDIEKAYEAIEDSELFQKDVTELSDDERTRVLELWSSYLDYVLEIEKMKHLHKHFYQINYIKNPELNSRSFLIAYSAFIANYKNSLKLSRLIGDNPNFETLLNEERIELSIPADGYFHLKQGLTQPKNLIRLNAGRANLLLVKGDEEELVAYTEEGFSDIYDLLGQTPELFVKNPLDYFERRTFTTWFPLQKRVTAGVSIVKISRDHFITQEDIAELKTRLEPGDIMFQRRNWQLTNIGLPGFWTHTALYVGSLDDLDEYFKDNTVIEIPVSEHIQQNYPKFYNDFSQMKDGHPISVLEALKEGVLVQSLEVSADADYLGVLRPRIPKDDKLLALFVAFAFYGRPYDFNFDFVTDNELVCSEVVYKAFTETAEKLGVPFELITVAGRLVLPPNDIVRRFGDVGAEATGLDFVAFLDEEEGAAVFRDSEAFGESWSRQKWKFAE